MRHHVTEGDLPQAWPARQELSAARRPRAEPMGVLEAPARPARRVISVPAQRGRQRDDARRPAARGQHECEPATEGVADDVHLLVPGGVEHPLELVGHRLERLVRIDRKIRPSAVPAERRRQHLMMWLQQGITNQSAAAASHSVCCWKPRCAGSSSASAAASTSSISSRRWSFSTVVSLPVEHRRAERDRALRRDEEAVPGRGRGAARRVSMQPPSPASGGSGR